jgi:hypothetical protein
MARPLHAMSCRTSSRSSLPRRLTRSAQRATTVPSIWTKGPPLRPERVHNLVDLTAHLDRFVGGRDRAGELRLAKRFESLLALEGVDAAHVTRRTVTAVDLEAVPGSSPGEGLNTCKSADFGDYRAPLDQGGLPNRLGHRSENSQQIGVLSDPMEHLPDKEGCGSATAAGSSSSRWKSTLFRGALSRPSALGTGGQEEQFGRSVRGLRRWLASPAS